MIPVIVEKSPNASKDLPELSKTKYLVSGMLNKNKKIFNLKFKGKYV